MNMQMEMKGAHVTGLGFFDGDIDGKNIKSGSIFIEDDLDESKGNSKGKRTVEHKCDADIVKLLMQQNEFPMYADVKFGSQVTRGAQKFVVVGVRPVAKITGEVIPPPSSAARK
jgi:hypothetical protein